MFRLAWVISLFILAFSASTYSSDYGVELGLTNGLVSYVDDDNAPRQTSLFFQPSVGAYYQLDRFWRIHSSITYFRSSHASTYPSRGYNLNAWGYDFSLTRNIPLTRSLSDVYVGFGYSGKRLTVENRLLEDDEGFLLKEFKNKIDYINGLSLTLGNSFDLKPVAINVAGIANIYAFDKPMALYGVSVKVSY